MTFALGLIRGASMLGAQTSNDTPDAHVAAAKTAAGSRKSAQRLGYFD
jgi:hypothetical protein